MPDAPAPTVIHMTRDLSAIPAVAEQARGLAAPHLDDFGIADVELALVEALTNAVRHGWIHSRSASDIIILVTITDTAIIIDIVDKSQPFPAHLLQDAGAHKLDFDPDDLETLHENGRGLSLIVMSMDDVVLHSSDDEFTLRMIKKFH